MSKAIERRLAIVERRLNPPIPVIQVITIYGGLPGSDHFTVATAGACKWERGPDESFGAFRARAKAVAEAEGEAFIVFGGLSESELGGT